MLRHLALLLLVAVTLVASCGGEETDPFRRGRSIYGNVCSTCHGQAGEGGVGPALDTVTQFWPGCADQVEWITLGSEGWRSAHGDTYGAVAREIKGGMPAQGENLTTEEIRAVAAFERIQYGGADREATLAECGVATAATTP